MTSNISDKLLILLKAKRDLDISIFCCKCRTLEEFLTLSEQRICEIKKSPNNKYDAVQRQIKYIQKLENELQKSFEKEVQEFLQHYQCQILDDHNLYHIKFGLQNILEKYQRPSYIKVIAQGNRVDIRESEIDFDIQIL